MISLTTIARQAMIDRGFLPDFSPKVHHELEKLQGPATCTTTNLTDLLWFSIDNDDSKDLDQITYIELLPNDKAKIFIGVADVDALVKKGAPIDKHAEHNTTSIYTPTKIFTMLPEKLSTNLTSLNPDETRVALVIEVVINDDGSFGPSSVYRACVKNQAQLTYNGVNAFLEGTAPPPPLAGLAKQLELQDLFAQKIKQYRYLHGALSFETIEPKAVVMGGEVVDITATQRNRATELIENFMIAANVATTQFLESKNFPTLRRVVRTPKRWDRIVELAAKENVTLPPVPNGKALEAFLDAMQKKDPVGFPDLSVSIIKLIGRGEYVASFPGEKGPGHFGLALRDYTHSTAPNRRYPDLITGRLIKAALDHKKIPYEPEELTQLGEHCTQKEDDAEKVERRLKKSAAALVLMSKIGKHFDAIVTGASAKGTWVRILHPPVEGKLTEGFHQLDVGDRLQVKLVHVDVAKGFIDFTAIPSTKR